MHPREPGPGLALLDVREIRFEEVPGPVLSRELLAAVDAAWEEQVRADPNLFDGPVVLCTELDVHPDRLDVRWSRATYRYRMVRRIRAAPALSSVFVCVLQPTSDGRLLVGRMSDATVDPGGLQFPGGNLEPPPPGQGMTIDAVRRHAAAELAEEAGIEAVPADLELSTVVRASNGNLGFVFRAPELPAGAIPERHASLAAAERSAGREPEFAAVALVADAAELALLGGHPVDYLLPLLHRFRTG